MRNRKTADRSGERRLSVIEISKERARGLETRLELADLCIEFAREAGDVEIDMMVGLLRMWRRGRISGDEESQVLNTAMKRSILLEPR